MKISDLENYIDNIYNKTADLRLANSKIRERIRKPLDNACKITGLPIKDLLTGLDLKPNDQTIEALESFLAELRSIFWLRDFGFTNIFPLKASRKNVQPDFIAEYKGDTCAIEVFCLTQKYEQGKDASLNVYVNFDPNFSGSKFGRDFMSKAKEKKIQLDSSNANIKILLCVVNSDPVINLNTADEMKAHAKFLYDTLNWKAGYYIGILTGVKVNGQLSDTIYPLLT